MAFRRDSNLYNEFSGEHRLTPTALEDALKKHIKILGDSNLEIRRMCEACGIEPDECVVFGDGDNDIEYVQAAGLGIAMSNARDVLKAVADRETELI